MESGRLKREILRSALEAGFSRARILAPWPGGGGRGAAPSLLVCALPYGNGPQEAGAAGAETANAVFIAPFARRNYYHEAVERLQTLARLFRRRFIAGGGERRDFQILCNSRLPEKPLAAAAGLGAWGRNGLVITPEAGSLVILAAMTLPFPLEGDGPLPGGPFPFCAACTDGTPAQRDAGARPPPCAAACPAGALPGDGSLIRNRCIQWYASGAGVPAQRETGADTAGTHAGGFGALNQDGGLPGVPAAVARHWGRRLYGCTLCQDACPRNRRPVSGVDSGKGPLPPWLDGRELLTLNNEELRARFRGTALGSAWLRPEALRRNIRTALAQNTAPGPEASV